jgi:L-2-hydroxyglutarate oxidase
MYDCVIVGGGIVGLATAMMLSKREPNAKICLLEKESELACHQSGNNSGVIHSGIYYKPNSLKAVMAREGNRTMVEFCREHGIRHEVCGKVIVATKEWELPRLQKLVQRGVENGLNVRRLSKEQVGEFEPHVRCLAGIEVPTTGIADYKGVCRKYAEILKNNGGELLNGTELMSVREGKGSHRLLTSTGEIESRFIVNCAGLHSDRVAKLFGLQPQAKIVPFRGEYFELIPERRYLVKGLIYPVPNPQFPFLGVHFTRMWDGSVHAGPNAVLAFKREGYEKTDFSLYDTWDTLTYLGFWKLAIRHRGEAWAEMQRSFRKPLFVRSLQEMIPEVTEADCVPAHAGVRAQALLPDGGMVDDFFFLEKGNTIHVCNAPSPAATASLEIGKAISGKVPPLTMAKVVAAGSIC